LLDRLSSWSFANNSNDEFFSRIKKKTTRPVGDSESTDTQEAAFGNKA
jgi:hypothetical protein